ncbi:unnamed protein product [Pylaiella littoralis]
MWRGSIEGARKNFTTLYILRSWRGVMAEDKGRGREPFFRPRVDVWARLSAFAPFSSSAIPRAERHEALLMARALAIHLLPSHPPLQLFLFLAHACPSKCR